VPGTRSEDRAGRLRLLLAPLPPTSSRAQSCLPPSPSLSPRRPTSPSATASSAASVWRGRRPRKKKPPCSCGRCRAPAPRLPAAPLPAAAPTAVAGSCARALERRGYLRAVSVCRWTFARPGGTGLLASLRAPVEGCAAGPAADAISASASLRNSRRGPSSRLSASASSPGLFWRALWNSITPQVSPEHTPRAL